MAPNDDNWWTSYDQSRNLDPYPIEEQDVSSAIAASLNERVYCTSELQKAILMSLDEKNKMRTESDQDQLPDVDGSLVKAEEGQPGEEHDKDTKKREISKLEMLESRIRELDQMSSWELPLLDDSRGDTLVFIDPPDQQPEQDDESYERCTVRYNTPMRVKKDILMKYGASYFEKIFEATYQFRILRRRGLVGKLPHHVKYVVDLTPPTDGDQAAYLMTELCCSEGVRKWYQATRRWDVSKSLVAGQDEYMLPRKVGSGPTGQGPEIDPSPMAPLEYSPVRHRSAIERVLLALQGVDPLLNSAPKVWTTFAVAKYFGVTPNSPLTDYIVRWLRVVPNSYFLEILPETALRIADGLQCQELCQDTFAILVGEEALGAAYRSRVPEFDRSRSVHGRRKEELPEGLRTAVEYASKALSDRVNAKFTSLVDDSMHWIDDLAEFRKLSNLGRLPESLEQVRTELILLLKAYVRGAVYTVLCTNFPSAPIIVAGTPEDDDFPTTGREEIWTKLVPRERILTRTFWSILRNSDLLRGPTNLHARLRLSDGLAMDTHGDAENAICQELSFNKISNKDIALRILSLKDRYDEYHATLFAGHISNGEGNAESSFIPSIDWWLYKISLKNESKYDSTENLLSNHNQNDVISEVSPHHSENGDSFNGYKKPSYNRNSLYNNEKSNSSQTFDRLPVNYKPAEFFHFGTFCAEAELYLKSAGSRMTNAHDIFTRAEGLDVQLTHTLVCLMPSEWKYLPLWAGGNDDGSGGVFADDVPLTHDGFSTAGPRVITSNQYSVDGNSTESSFTVISHSGTTHPHTSLLNNDSFSDALPRGIAVSNDGESSASSRTLDSYDIVPTNPILDEADKGFQNVPTLLDNLEINHTRADQDENMDEEMVELDEAFDDIFAYSSDVEEDEDGETINGDAPTETGTNEDDT